MAKIIKYQDKDLKLYLKIQKELKEYYNLYKKINYKNGMSYQEYDAYKFRISILHKRIKLILNRLRKRLGIMSIDKYLKVN